MAIHPPCGNRTMRVFCTGLIALAAVATLASSASAEWGDLKIKFKLAKELPKKDVEPVTRVGPCGDVPVFDQTAVGPALEVPNVMVWLHASDPSKVAVHPALADKAATEKAELAIEGCRYVPRCLIATAGQTLHLTNRDAYGYNPSVDFFANRSVNVLLQAGHEIEIPLGKAERRPAGAKCAVKPFLEGWIMVAPTPYYAVSNDEGAIMIKDLPVGDWEFKFWHEAHGFISKVVRNGEEEEWPKGRRTISIVQGENDLGEIKIIPKE